MRGSIEYAWNAIIANIAHPRGSLADAVHIAASIAIAAGAGVTNSDAADPIHAYGCAVSSND